MELFQDTFLNTNTQPYKHDPDEVRKFDKTCNDLEAWYIKTKTKAKKCPNLIHVPSEEASRQDPANGFQAAVQLADAILAGYNLADDCGIEYHLRWQDEVQAFILAAESLEQIPKTNHTKTVISSLTAIANGLLRCIKDDDKKRARFLQEFPDYNFDLMMMPMIQMALPLSAKMSQMTTK